MPIRPYDQTVFFQDTQAWNSLHFSNDQQADQFSEEMVSFVPFFKTILKFRNKYKCTLLQQLKKETEKVL